MSPKTHSRQPGTIVQRLSAKDLTKKIGPPFNFVSNEEKYNKMIKYLKEFSKKIKNKTNISIEIVTDYPDNLQSDISYFNVTDRTYIKRNTKIEQSFMSMSKFLI